MRGSLLSLNVWLDPNHLVPSPAYLDAHSLRYFVNWLRQDPARVQKLQSREWQVYISRYQLNRHYGSDTDRNRQITNLGIEFDTTRVRQEDEMFITEVLRVYFHNDATARPQAELLMLARRQAGNGQVTIISQHQAFWRIPLVNTYFIDPLTLTGQYDLPAQFDFFLDLDIHNLVRQAAEVRIRNGDHPTAIIETVKEFFEYVRQIITSTDDGYNLMKEAFSCQRWDPNLLPDPKIKLSSMSTTTEINDQKGFRDILYGVATALRNPIAHQPVDQAFIQTRYGDKRTVLKVLCLLSLLFEKVDSRVP